MLKKIFHKILKRLPFNSLKIYIYKNIFKYKIGKNVVIGKSIIIGNDVFIGDNVLIRDNTTIICDKLSIGSETSIFSGNTIMGSSSFKIGNNSRIINNHFIDLYNDVTIGNNTWIAGKESQFWTHGSIHTKVGNKDLSIAIGNDTYIGSRVSFAPGVKIGNNNLIGLGSVVTKSFLESNTIIAGNTAEVVKENIDWRENW